MVDLFKKIYKKFILSKHDKVVKKWYSDGGDKKFRYNYDLDENSLVWDLGGYHGHWSSEMFTRYNCNIMIFEPVLEYYEIIKDKFINNKKVKIYNFALGSSNRKETIFLDDTGSSIIKKSKKTSTIEIKDVKNFLNAQCIKNIDLMKINIEGGEYEFLERLLEISFIPNITDLQIQFHDFESNSVNRMNDISKKLEKTHSKTYSYEFVWDNWRLNN